MRAFEFISETKIEKTNTEHSSTMQPSMSISDMDSYYEFYRFMNVIAGDPENEVSSAHEHFRDTPLVMAYTPQEQEMLMRSIKKMGKKAKFITRNNGTEPSTTNSVSPVPHNSGARRKSNENK